MHILSQLPAVVLCECAPHPFGKISLMSPGQQFLLLWVFSVVVSGQVFGLPRELSSQQKQRAVFLLCCWSEGEHWSPASEQTRGCCLSAVCPRGTGAFPPTQANDSPREPSQLLLGALFLFLQTPGMALLSGPSNPSFSCVFPCAVGVLYAGCPSPQRQLSNCFTDPRGPTCFPSMLRVFLFSCWQHLQIGKLLALSANWNFCGTK